MNCENTRENLTLFVHGELNFDEEEQLENHVASCAACARELAMERAILELAEAHRLEPAIGQLAMARRQLANRIASEKRGWWASISEWFDFHPGLQFALKPIAGLLLAGVGFFTGWVVREAKSDWGPVAQRVRFVESAKSGQVELVIDEIRQQKLLGEVDDPRIRHLLLTAAKDSDDAGLRAEALDAFKGRTESVDIRGVLLTALEKDVNSEVRMRALEALKPYTAYSDVQRAVQKALLNDENPEVRTMAIDMLIPINKPDVAGTLQKVMESESNQYVRQRSQSALVAMKASTDTF